MIHAYIRMLIPLQKQKEALSILEAAAEEARRQKGCSGCQIYKGSRDRRLIHFEQRWDNEEDMNRHLRSEDYRTVLLVMEMALERPIVRFDHVAASTGMDTIAVARLNREELLEEGEDDEQPDDAES